MGSLRDIMNLNSTDNRRPLESVLAELSYCVNMGLFRFYKDFITSIKKNIKFIETSNHKIY